MNKSPVDIILKPHITERTLIQMSEGKYTFFVNPHATKIEIKSAVKQLFKVDVIKVNVINLPGKPKRWGTHRFTRSNRSKAVCTIAEGQSIDEMINIV